MGSIAIAKLTILETIRRKEFYVVLILIAALAVWMQAMNLSSSGAGRFAKDIVMQVAWLASFALAAPLAVRQISSDVEQKTVYVLVSRPIHRRDYVFGRALGASAASVICFTGLFLMLLLMLMVKGSGTLTDAALWQAYALQVVALMVLCSTAVFFSTFASPGGAVTFSMMILILTRYGGPAMIKQIENSQAGIGRQTAWWGYMMLPHYDFFNIGQRVVHGWGALPTVVFAQLVVYGILYSVAMTALASSVFRKRWI